MWRISRWNVILNENRGCGLFFSKLTGYRKVWISFRNEDGSRLTARGVKFMILLLKAVKLMSSEKDRHSRPEVHFQILMKDYESPRRITPRINSHCNSPLKKDQVKSKFVVGLHHQIITEFSHVCITLSPIRPLTLLWDRTYSDALCSITP